MPATAAAPAKARTRELPRAKALEVIQSMPMLVAASNTLIPPGSVVNVAFEVEVNRATYTFPEQPFRVLREITPQEYKAALPKELSRIVIMRRHYYEIFTD